MATASASPHTRPRPSPRAHAVSLWRRPLLVGLCMALGYGLTQRLLDLRLPALVQWGQSFEPRDRPGTSLESLRLRFGAEAHDLRGRLDLQQLETQQTAVDPAALPADAPADTPALNEALTPAAPPLPAEAPPAPRQP